MRYQIIRLHVILATVISSIGLIFSVVKHLCTSVWTVLFQICFVVTQRTCSQRETNLRLPLEHNQNISIIWMLCTTCFTNEEGLFLLCLCLHTYVSRLSDAQAVSQGAGHAFLIHSLSRVLLSLQIVERKLGMPHHILL